MKARHSTRAGLLLAVVMPIGVCACASPGAEAKLPAVEVETLDARVLKGGLLAVTDKVVRLRAGRKGRTVPRGDVAEIRLAPAADPMAAKGQAIILGAAGHRLAANALTIADGKVRFQSPLLGATVLPLNDVSVIYLPAGSVTAASLRDKHVAMKVDNRSRDLLLVGTKGSEAWLTVRGIFESLDDRRVIFEWDDKERTVARSVVRVIQLAAVPRKLPKSAGTLVGRDGSSIEFTALTIDGRKLTVQGHGIARRTLALGAVAAVRLRSDRVVGLSTLKPHRVRQHGFLDKAVGWRKDRAVSGKPLRLDGKTYAAGLGMHSFCEMSFDLGGKYTRFVAVVGIDDAIRPMGDATVTFLGDGKPLAKALHVTGQTPAKVVRLDVTKVKIFAVRVEFGPDKIDVGDHVNLAAARLIK